MEDLLDRCAYLTARSLIFLFEKIPFALLDRSRELCFPETARGLH